MAVKKKLGKPWERYYYERQVNMVDSLYLEKNLDIYYEFPPVFKNKETRWGDEWSEAKYPTPLPLLEIPEKDFHIQYHDEAAAGYTWIYYTRLK